MNVLHKKINSDFSDSLNVHSFSYIMFVMSTIKYPNAISTINTMQQKSYSSRGMRLENDMEEYTITSKAKRDIKAGEELTWDYACDIWFDDAK